MTSRFARSGRGGASRGDLLSGLLLGALFGFLQIPEVGSVLTRLPASSQLHYAAFTWYSYAALGWLAAWLCGHAPGSVRGRSWAAAAAPAVGVWLEIVARGDGPAPLPRHAAALLAAGLVFLAASRAARRFPVLQAPALWAAANLAGFLLLGLRFWGSPARPHGVEPLSLLLLAPAILLPLGLLLRGLRPRRSPRPPRILRPVVATAASCLALLALAGTRSRPAQEARPNVLLITVDTLRADHVGCYGSRTARTPATPATPAMDALAREGVLVETAISPVPLTGPSHTTLLTGLYPARHGVTLNQPVPLKTGVRTLPEILAGQGYATAAFVSGITLKNFASALPGRFQLYDADFSRVPFIPELLLSNSLARLALREMGKPSGWFERKAGRTVEAASRWLRNQGDDGAPFFLWVHLYDPHGPYTPPPPFDKLHGAEDGGRTRGNWYGVPVGKRGEFLADPRELRILRALYAGEVSYADQQVGRLLATLRSLGLLERTLVVLTSDHGESLTEHGYYFDHSVQLYDADLRVPLLLRLPGHLDGKKWAGSRIQRLSGLTDVTPTVLDLLGLPIPRRVDGAPLLRDLMKGAKGGPAATPPPVVSAVFQGEIAGAKSLLALRTREHKYIRVSPWWGDHLLIPGHEELYDLARDPGEDHDLAAREPALLARYRSLAEPYWRDWLVPAQGGAEERALEGAEELRALGYLQ